MGGSQSNSRETLRSINRELAASGRRASKEQRHNIEETDRLERELREQGGIVRKQREALEGWRRVYAQVSEAREQRERELARREMELRQGAGRSARVAG